MGHQVTLGGDRLGSGKKQKVSLHGYERSTHDMGYIWRSTMSAGTLVPFLSEVGLPGDTFDIDLDCDIKTHPTIGPLFGSYKIQLDIFQAPIRLYQGQLHNNKLGIGMNMSEIKLPLMEFTAHKGSAEIQQDNKQINPSCILSYLGLRGIGQLNSTDNTKTRQFNGVPWLAYWEIYKQYYANKQEEIGAVIHTPVLTPPAQDVVEIGVTTNGNSQTLPESPTELPLLFNQTTIVTTDYTGGVSPGTGIIVKTNTGISYSLDQLFYSVVDNTTDEIRYTNYKWAQFGDLTIVNWRYATTNDIPIKGIQITTFDLDHIDQAREEILAQVQNTAPFLINTIDLAPYNLITLTVSGINESLLASQEGLALKTYQSDLFNNWLSTDWIDGVGGITEITAIDTSGGSFTIDTLNLSKKVYNMLNRIAVSGGSYDDWIDAVYTNERTLRAESPMYMGGLIRELVFQEVVSNSEANTDSGTQPLGTLAGKGIMASKKKGGKITVKIDEPGYIIGIISLTPRIDYSQGNKWDLHLETLDDLHKPALDEIGFQELITEQMAWWSTSQDSPAGPWITRSAGKQPAWINYMTNVNQTRGNFADKNNEMFMTLNRQYEIEPTAGQGILDLTTYIDPAKFNNIFAQTSLDSQNFWAQISVDMTARRKMSAKIMPNL